MAGLHVNGGDQPIAGHPPGDTKDPVVVLLDVLAGHQRQHLGSLAQRPGNLVTVQLRQSGHSILDQRIHQRIARLRIIPVTRRLAHAGVVIVTGQPRAHRARNCRIGGRPPTAPARIAARN